MSLYTKHPLGDEEFKLANSNNSVFRIGLKRIYVQDLSSRDYNLENTTPYYFSANDFHSSENSWSNLILELIIYLQANYEKSIDELVAFRTDWSKAAVFGKDKFISNCKQVSDNLYVSVNFTALHAVWFIADILNFYGVKKENCLLYIHRSPRAEPKEITDLLITWMKENFKTFLLNRSYSEKTCEIIIKNIDLINRIQEKISPAYGNFFLIDNSIYVANNKQSFFKNCINETGWSSKQINQAKKCLDLYTEFYTKIQSENKN